MRWKEIEEEVIEELKEEQKSWLRRKVELETKDLHDMSTEEVRRIFPGKPKSSDDSEETELSTVNDSKLIYTLIWQSYLKLKVKELEPFGGNLRTFWYEVQHPFFKNHDLLETDEGPPLSVEVYRELMALAEEDRNLQRALMGAYRGKGRELYLQDRMSKSFDQFVIRGFFRFQDEFKFKDTREAFRIIGRTNPRFILYTEKEGLFWRYKKIALELGITIIASHGEPGYLTMEYFSDELKKRKVKNVEVAALTDYDPWGFNIAKSFGEKMSEPVFGFGVHLSHLTGLELFEEESIDYFKRDLRKVSLNKKKQVERWLKETGGINGEPWGLHIDNADFPRIEKAVKKWYKDVKG